MRVLYINTFDPTHEVHGGATVTRTELDLLRSLAEVDTLFASPLRTRYKHINYARLLVDLLRGRSLKYASYNVLHRPPDFYRQYDLIFCSHDFAAFDFETFDRLRLPFIVRKLNSEYQLIGDTSLLGRIERARIRRFEEDLGRRAKAVIHISSTEHAADTTSPRKVHLFPPLLSAPAGGFSRPLPAYAFSERPIDLLCVSNFNWPPNREGMDWFLDGVFPLLGASVQLHLVGLGGDRYARRRSVSVHGFVEDLYGFYSRSKLFIAPVLSGAGIKVKSLSALLAGIPLVSTTRGADGLYDAVQAHAITVRDGADAFARGIEDLLANEHACAQQARLALDWARREVTTPDAWKSTVSALMG